MQDNAGFISSAVVMSRQTEQERHLTKPGTSKEWVYLGFRVLGFRFRCLGFIVGNPIA